MKRRGGIKPPFNLGLLNLGVKILFLIIITVTFITTFRRKNIEGMEGCVQEINKYKNKAKCENAKGNGGKKIGLKWIEYSTTNTETPPPATDTPPPATDTPPPATDTTKTATA
jgi:hypothetical protein